MESFKLKIKRKALKSIKQYLASGIIPYYALKILAYNTRNSILLQKIWSKRSTISSRIRLPLFFNQRLKTPQSPLAWYQLYKQIYSKPGLREQPSNVTG